jgi:L-ascorbate metabolism protein UlaG (beta-lactamase superfamily)
VELTNFAHSCVRLDDGDRSLVIDPGVFSDVDRALDGASDVLITHEHPDHIDVDRLRAAVERDSRLRVWGPPSVGGLLAKAGEQFTAVSPGESFEAGGFAVRPFGGQHAVIHSSIPVIANVAYLVDESVYHPGDSFAVPPVSVPTLLLPVHAPWSKIAEVIDFVIAVRPKSVHQIHDALLNEVGLGMVEGHVSRIGEQYGAQFRHVAAGDSVTVA